MVRAPATWGSLCSTLACRVSGEEPLVVSPCWLAREGSTGENVDKRQLEAAVLVSVAGDSPFVSAVALDALVSREFPGIGQEKILVEALWSCSESGPSLALAPKRSVGAVLRITGPTDEPDGYREISPA